MAYRNEPAGLLPRDRSISAPYSPNTRVISVSPPSRLHAEAPVCRTSKCNMHPPVPPQPPFFCGNRFMREGTEVSRPLHGFLGVASPNPIAPPSDSGHASKDSAEYVVPESSDPDGCRVLPPPPPKPFRGEWGRDPSVPVPLPPLIDAPVRMHESRLRVPPIRNASPLRLKRIKGSGEHYASGHLVLHADNERRRRSSSKEKSRLAPRAASPVRPLCLMCNNSPVRSGSSGHSKSRSHHHHHPPPPVRDTSVMHFVNSPPPGGMRQHSSPGSVVFIPSRRQSGSRPRHSSVAADGTLVYIPSPPRTRPSVARRSVVAESAPICYPQSPPKVPVREQSVVPPTRSGRVASSSVSFRDEIDVVDRQPDPMTEFNAKYLSPLKEAQRPSVYRTQSELQEPHYRPETRDAQEQYESTGGLPTDREELHQSTPTPSRRTSSKSPSHSPFVTRAAETSMTPSPKRDKQVFVSNSALQNAASQTFLDAIPYKKPFREFTFSSSPRSALYNRTRLRLQYGDFGDDYLRFRATTPLRRIYSPLGRIGYRSPSCCSRRGLSYARLPLRSASPTKELQYYGSRYYRRPLARVLRSSLGNCYSNGDLRSPLSRPLDLAQTPMSLQNKTVDRSLNGQLRYGQDEFGEATSGRASQSIALDSEQRQDTKLTKTGDEVCIQMRVPIYVTGVYPQQGVSDNNTNFSSQRVPLNIQNGNFSIETPIGTNGVGPQQQPIMSYETRNLNHNSNERVLPTGGFVEISVSEPRHRTSSLQTSDTRKSF